MSVFVRFEFDMSAEDAQKRVLSVCVKHSSSFMSREKDVIGQVSQQIKTRLPLNYSLHQVLYSNIINTFPCL